MYHSGIFSSIYAGLFIFAVLCLFSCSEVAKKIAEETGRVIIQRDSVMDERNEKPVAIDNFTLLEAKKDGDDSLFLMRQFYITGEKYADSWFLNRSLRQGISRFYYRSGRLSYSMAYNNDTVMELLEAYTPDGEKRSDSQLKNGTGHLKLYHPVTYKLQLDCWLKNGKKQGSFSMWYANGNKREKGTFTGDFALDYMEWYTTGTIKSEVVRKPGSVNTFTYTTYYAHGKPELLHMQYGDYSSITSKFDGNGNITETQNQSGTHINSSKYYYDANNALLSRGSYLDEKKHGNYEYFFEDGAKKSLEIYVHDTMISEQKWYQNGQLLLTVGYKNNSYHGMYRDYYPNGNKRVEQEYVEGIKHGSYNSYFENGNKYYEGVFENGKPKGEMITHSRDGKQKRSKNY